MKHKIRGYSEELYGYIRNNSLRLPNYMAELSDDQLNFDQSNDSEGVLFRALSDATEIKVADYLKVTNNRIIFSVLSSKMPTGEYILLVRRNYTVRKELDTGELNVVLTLS